MTITHEVGLHARPSVKFTKLAKSFAAEVEMALSPQRSVVRRQEHRQGDGRQGAEGHDAASARRGRGADEAIDALVGLVERDFDEGAAMPEPLRLKGIAASGGYAEGPLFPLNREEGSYLARGNPHEEAEALHAALAHASAPHRRADRGRRPRRARRSSNSSWRCWRTRR